MPLPETVEDAIRDEYVAGFNADTVSDEDEEGLQRNAVNAAEDLVTLLGPEAATAAELLRAMLADRRHPFFEALNSDTLIGWNASDENYELFRRLTETVVDNIDQGLA
jgi:hypothetical protein